MDKHQNNTPLLFLFLLPTLDTQASAGSPRPLPFPPTPPTLSLFPVKMSVSLATDIQQEGESGPLVTEPCSRGKGSPQPQAPKEGGGEGQELDDGSMHDAQVRRHGEDGETGVWKRGLPVF